MLRGRAHVWGAGRRLLWRYGLLRAETLHFARSAACTNGRASMLQASVLRPRLRAHVLCPRLRAHVLRP